MRYLSYLSEREVPPAAADLDKQAESFRVLIGNLQLIVGKYNSMVLTLLPVEKPLLDRELKAMDGLLEQAITHLTWRSPNVKTFVREALDQVRPTCCSAAPPAAVLPHLLQCCPVRCSAALRAHGR